MKPLDGNNYISEETISALSIGEDSKAEPPLYIQDIQE
jgi:hypothetical protein